MIVTKLHELTIAEMGRMIGRHELSPVDLAEAHLARIEALDGTLHAFITVTAERALADAGDAEAEIAAGRRRGPLHGIPIALKDLYDTVGIRTTAHSRVYLERVPSEDSRAAALLRSAGTVLLGKLSMHEFATGAPDLEGPFPPARNPWDLSRMPSGSSSGSGAGLAAGLCAGSLGSDTGGSIRGPASWCGIVGHKPTYGLVSRYGVVPLSWSYDHAGPMARTVEDAALLLQAIAGYDPRDDGSANVPIPDYRAELATPIDGLRVGVPRRYLDSVLDLDRDVYTVVRTAIDDLARLGARLVDIELPYADHLEAIGLGILLPEAFAFHEQNFRQRRELYGKPFLRRVLPAGLHSAADYIQAGRARQRFVRATSEIMRDVDVIAMPTTPQTAEPFTEADAYGSKTSFTRIFNITGQPSVSVPCGFSEGGLPVGLMLSGRLFEDGTVLRLAHAYEQAHEWSTRRPPEPLG